MGLIHIIEDDDAFRGVLIHMLERTEHEAMYFEFGEQYLVYINSPKFREPTLVLSDIVLPGIDGYELVHEIRGRLPFQKIILMTGYGFNPGKLGQAAIRELCYFLKKPFRAEQLIRIIDALNSCAQALANGDKVEYFGQCEFGAGPACPFQNRDKRTNRRSAGNHVPPA